MTQSEQTTRDIRALTADELAATAGGAHNIWLRLGRYALIFQGGDGWSATCVSGPEQYYCVVNSGGSVTTSSGPVPK